MSTTLSAAKSATWLGTANPKESWSAETVVKLMQRHFYGIPGRNAAISLDLERLSLLWTWNLAVHSGQFVALMTPHLFFIMDFRINSISHWRLKLSHFINYQLIISGSWTIRKLCSIQPSWRSFRDCLFWRKADFLRRKRRREKVTSRQGACRWHLRVLVECRWQANRHGEWRQDLQNLGRWDQLGCQRVQNRWWHQRSAIWLSLAE